MDLPLDRYWAYLIRAAALYGTKSEITIGGMVRAMDAALIAR